jgi:hypothetical protein
MRSHRRRRCHGVTPPDPVGERRLLWPPLDNSIGMAEAGNCSDDRYTSRSVPTGTNPRNRRPSSAGLIVRIHSALAVSQTNSKAGQKISLATQAINAERKYNTGRSSDLLPLRYRQCSYRLALDCPRVVDIEIDVVAARKRRRGHHRHYRRDEKLAKRIFGRCTLDYVPPLRHRACIIAD